MKQTSMTKSITHTYSCYSCDAAHLMGNLIRERKFTTQKVTATVGVKLFDAQTTSLTKHIRQTEEKLTLLPKSIRKTTRLVNDDF